MMTRLVFFVFLVKLLFPVFGYGQTGGFMRPGNVPTAQEPQAITANTDDPEWNLPPLQTLIDITIGNSTVLKLADTHIKAEEEGLRDLHREWLSRINFMADTRYGTMYDYSRLVVTPDVPITPSVMWSYGAGATASMSLADIFDRKRTKQKTRLRIEQSKLTKEETISEVTQLVINAYYEVLTAQKMLAMSNELSLTAGLVFDKAKLDYSQNRISFTDYAKENEAYLSIQNTVELQRLNLMRTIRTLEVIVGIELLNMN